MVFSNLRSHISIPTLDTVTVDFGFLCLAQNFYPIGHGDCFFLFEGSELVALKQRFCGSAMQYASY
jgi:hypothetical protein